MLDSSSRLFLNHRDGACLETLLALRNLKLHFHTFFQGAIPFALDFGIVDEQVFAVFLGDEAIPFFSVEPFDSTLSTVYHCVFDS